MNAPVARPCPVCGSRESRLFAESNVDPALLDQFAFASRKLPEYMHHRLVECRQCDLVHTSEVPDVQALGDAYREAAYDSDVEARAASRTYARVLDRLLASLPDRRGAVDIGTGNGSFLEELLERGFENVAGVEPSRAPVEAARPAIRPLIRHGLFDPKAFAPGSLSLATCFQTLEHVADPLGLSRDIATLLRPGGLLLFVVHNRRALSATVLGRRSPIYDVEHLQLFSPRSARALCTAAGLSDYRCRPLLNSYPLRYWVRLFPLPAGPKQTALRFLERGRLGAIPVAIPAGNLIVAARRPR